MHLRIEKINGEFFLDYEIKEGKEQWGHKKTSWKNHSVWPNQDEALKEKERLTRIIMESEKNIPDDCQ